MIDYESFWLEHDEEQLRKEIAQVSGQSPESIHLSPWIRPPLDDATLTACEAEWNVRFPEPLVKLLKIHNGGSVRGYEELCIHPLVKVGEQHLQQAIRPLSDCVDLLFREPTLRRIRKQIGDPQLIFVISDDSYSCVALNFNERGAEADPSVLAIGFDDSEYEISVRQEAETFDQWIRRIVEVEEQAPIDWNEIDSFSVIARSTTNGPDWSTSEQVLCEAGNELIYFIRTNNRNGEVESLERTVLPKALERDPLKGWDGTINFVPADGHEARRTSSRRVENGWKTEVSTGALYCPFSSTSEKTLQDIRRRLLSPEALDELVAQEKEDAAWIANFAPPGEIPEDPEDMLRQFQQMNAQLDEEFGPATDEVALVTDHIQGMLAQAFQNQKSEDIASSETPASTLPGDPFDPAYSMLALARFSLGNVEDEESALDAVHELGELQSQRNRYRLQIDPGTLPPQVIEAGLKQLDRSQTIIREELSRIREIAPGPCAQLEQAVESLLATVTEFDTASPMAQALEEEWTQVGERLSRLLPTIKDAETARQILAEADQLVDKLTELHQEHFRVAAEAGAVQVGPSHNEHHRMHKRLRRQFERYYGQPEVAAVLEPLKVRLQMMSLVS